MSSFENLKNLLKRFENENILIGIILLCETFLKGSDTQTDNANILKIEEYDFIYTNRINKSKGGGGGAGGGGSPCILKTPIIINLEMTSQFFTKENLKQYLQKSMMKTRNPHYLPKSTESLVLTNNFLYIDMKKYYKNIKIQTIQN